MLLNLDKMPTSIDILLVNLMICSARFSFSSSVMPKYFTDLLMETGSFLNSISIVCMGLVILESNIKVEDFLGLTIILLALIHSSTFRNSLCTIKQN